MFFLRILFIISSLGSVIDDDHIKMLMTNNPGSGHTMQDIPSILHIFYMNVVKHSKTFGYTNCYNFCVPDDLWKKLNGLHFHLWFLFKHKKTEYQSQWKVYSLQQCEVKNIMGKTKWEQIINKKSKYSRKKNIFQKM